MPGRAVTAAAVFLLLTAVLAAGFGTEPVSLLRALRDRSSIDHAILFDARLPRVMMAGVAGGGLAMVGAAFQAVLGNPLAEPYMLGVSGGAALGATLTIIAGMAGTTILGASAVPAVALLGGLGATAVVYSVARSGGTTTRTGMLLAGIVVNAIAGAAITLVKTLVTAAQAQELLFWLMGFVDVPSTAQLVFVSLYVGAGAAMLVCDAGRLNLLALGDEGAAHLGVDVRRLERRTFVACSLVVGAIVSVTGLIGFVGLVVPHALRRLFGPDTRAVLPASMFAGGGLLILCDLASRATFRWLHTEPPVGAVTAIVGGPVFLALLRRHAEAAS